MLRLSCAGIVLIVLQSRSRVVHLGVTTCCPSINLIISPSPCSLFHCRLLDAVLVSSLPGLGGLSGPRSGWLGVAFPQLADDTASAAEKWFLKGPPHRHPTILPDFRSRFRLAMSLPLSSPLILCSHLTHVCLRPLLALRCAFCIGSPSLVHSI